MVSFFLFAFCSNMPVSLAVCETSSIKEWRDLENWIIGCSRSLKTASFDRSRDFDFLLVGHRGPCSLVSFPRSARCEIYWSQIEIATFSFPHRLAFDAFVPVEILVYRKQEWCMIGVATADTVKKFEYQRVTYIYGQSCDGRGLYSSRYASSNKTAIN